MVRPSSEPASRRIPPRTGTGGRVGRLRATQATASARPSRSTRIFMSVLSRHEGRLGRGRVDRRRLGETQDVGRHRRACAGAAPIGPCPVCFHFATHAFAHTHPPAFSLLITLGEKNSRSSKSCGLGG